jgi:putative ABC transport system permease protein
MFRHDLQLALLSIRRNPFISAIIVAVIAIGIGTSAIAITLYHAKAGNPIWWKNDVLYRVMLDSRPAPHGIETSRHPEYPPFTLIYRDAMALYQSNIPAASVMLLHAVGPVGIFGPQNRPLKRTANVTTREFFSMFDVPFLYGQAWSKSDDDEQSQVAILSRYLSERLFGAGNTVGRSISFSGQRFKVIGVIDRWQPRSRSRTCSFPDIASARRPALRLSRNSHRPSASL